MSRVVVCTWGTSGGAEELLTLARGVAAGLEATLGWVVLGPAPHDVTAIASRQDVPVVDHIEHEKLQSFGGDVAVAALADYVRQHDFRVLLVPQTFDARLLAPRLAARIDAGVVMNGLGVVVEGGALAVTASAYGGDTRVVYTLAGEGRFVIGVATSALAAEPAPNPATAVTRHCAVDLAAVEERVQVVTRSEQTGPRIEEADVLVAGGRGLGEKANYRLVEELAEALGGMAAASRPIVDEGWAEPARQVGLTGKITRPTLYIAAGISGASQHMVGCAAAKTLVAINRDPEAAIFRYARYGIVGDCLEILPALTRAVKG
ncbi:MAG: electron transfer flavoprotein subunit alpha/FixB family protein [Deltaproteobacteria bacterium]|nr:electron transfer flavoprotein subunit alpha/FixB family protein [Deltaproteobacteria bacterium]